MASGVEEIQLSVKGWTVAAGMGNHCGMISTAETPHSSNRALSRKPTSKAT
jgi:hypothetical protein